VTSKSEPAHSAARGAATDDQVRQERPSAGRSAIAAKALLTLFDAPDPPARLFLGADAHGLVEQQLDEMKSETAAWETLSRSTGFAS
jgi:hypothetical protein